jgi:spermidine synthase
MGVSSHLRIRLDEYDARIRTFIPGYDDMIEAAAHTLGALPSATPHVIDLGTGTGALASRCLHLLPEASLTAVDADAAILDLARQRLNAHDSRVSFVHASFLDYPLPSCDAIVASLALHHIATHDAKRLMYRRCRAALHAGGLLVSADCFPSSAPRLAALEHESWRAHMHRAYSPEETETLFAAWAEEDVYFSLTDELTMLRDAGFVPDIVWRSGAMGVIAAA